MHFSVSSEAPHVFPVEPTAEVDVAEEISTLCSADHSYADGSVFNSICSAPLDFAAATYARYAETNMGDNRIFPGLHQAENRVIQMLGSLLNARDAEGAVVSGGTEANLLACAAALSRFREKHSERRPQVLAPESIHFSFEKIATLLGFELVTAKIDTQFRVDLDDLCRKINARTALIVVTAGTSECGAVDDVESTSRIAEEAGIPLHVDAATGGFLIPFARDLGYLLPNFDFSLPGVASITVDPHKYGFAPPPAGCILFRPNGPLRNCEFASHYLGTANHKCLLGTRPGAAVLAVYAVLRRLGRAGYRQIVQTLFAQRDGFIDAARERGYELAYTPDLTIVGLRESQPETALSYLEAHGIIASLSRRYRFLRIVAQRHLSSGDYVRLLSVLDDYKRKAHAA
jgi:tyrosine decarboxylase / aspartate 1-decarboxylase